MKARKVFMGAVCIAAALAIGQIIVRAQEEPQKDQPKSEKKEMAGGQQGGQMSPEMEAWMKYGQPDEHSELLKRLEGNWKVDGKWRADENSPWQEFKGTTESTIIYDGRYLKQESSSEPDSSGMAGQEYKGLGFWGYDKHKNKYVSAWIDNMSTTIMSAEGTADPSGRQITMQSTYFDPMANKEVQSKYVMRIVGEDKLVEEGFTIKDGKEIKTMEITSTRP